MEIVTPTAALPRPRRYSFAQKIVLAAALVALADNLFFLQRIGSTLGLFALALLITLLVATPAIGRSRPALVAASAALAFALLLGDDPSLLAAFLFLTAAAMAALLPRTKGFDDGWRWAQRLLLHALLAAIAPLLDWGRLRSARRRRGRARLAGAAAVLALPILGTALFLALFTAANPLINNAFARLDLMAAVGGFSIARLFFWLVVTLPVWSLLRPPRAALAPQRAPREALPLPGVTLPSIALSLAAFNALFALQNGLDIAFLWSGAPLPGDMTLADYAHRGAYPLIATALLAALFVLVTLRPGSEAGESPLVRRLVSLWIAQNVVLVASTMLRTLDYVEAYSLTRLRIAALVWMALVAIGLVLICVRLLRGKSGAWLINANLAAALLALTACAAVDLGAVAAAWNVRHSREVGGEGVRLDLCYLNALDSSALLPLIELESRPIGPRFRERVSWTRNLILDRLETRQGDWHGWTWRDSGRLAQARRLVAERRLPRFAANIRDCDGRLLKGSDFDSSAGRV
jgi:MFS family permease